MSALPHDERELIDYVTAQRWFGSKTRHVAHARVRDAAQLREADPELYAALVEVRFDPGTHETYQLLPTADAFDALDEPAHALELVRLMRSGASAPSGEGAIEFHAV